jgi:hypothetical protein
VFTDHAVERAYLFDIPHSDVADAVLYEHEHRQRNPGSGDWFVRRGALVVVYNWPDGDDPLTARVITVWAEE